MKKQIELIKEIEDNLTLLKVRLGIKNEEPELIEITSTEIARDIIENIQFDFRDRNRTMEYKWYRFLYFYLAKKYTSEALKTIAVNGGVDNHATVLNGLKVWYTLHGQDKEFTRFVTPLRIRLEGKYIKKLQND
jgi:chromosomal replication initiation ATPase DnaA